MRQRPHDVALRQKVQQIALRWTERSGITNSEESLAQVAESLSNRFERWTVLLVERALEREHGALPPRERATTESVVRCIEFGARTE